MGKPCVAGRWMVSGAGARSCADIDDEFLETHRVFAKLTSKQHQVINLVAELRTSKEIAWLLGISESAVNQRIGTVRGRVGNATRAELARRYRRYLEFSSA